LAGPFPAELQNDLVFVGAVAADSKEADAAEAFITYLKAAAVFKAKGVKPRLRRRDSQAAGAKPVQGLLAVKP
jgi:hypothetical protein